MSLLVCIEMLRVAKNFPRLPTEGTLHFYAAAKAKLSPAFASCAGPQSMQVALADASTAGSTDKKNTQDHKDRGCREWEQYWVLLGHGGASVWGLV